ncbi:MAG: response regulator, partial [Coriobacteriia bacterium]|nr:response regulator [Coriobacteriia bacterium]
MAETRVLIVHEDKDFFDSTARVLGEAIPGCASIGAISAPRGLGMAKQHRPNLIIADGDLVGMDGYKFTAELKSDPELADIPVLIVAGEPTEASALRARQVGAAGHLPHSVDAATLVQKVSGLIGAGAEGQSGTAPGVTAGNAAVAPATAVAEPVGVSSGVPGPASATVDASDRSDVPHVDDLLRIMIDQGGSDLHLTVGSPPGVRVRGNIVPVEGVKVLTSKDTQEMLLN